METVTFNPPKAKRWVNIPQQPPFPTPIGTLIGHTPNANDWPTFKGHLQGNSVCITNRSHAEALTHMVREAAFECTHNKWTIHYKLSPV